MKQVNEEKINVEKNTGLMNERILMERRIQNLK